MTIGILTSGGDAPGINACISTIAILAEKRGVPLRGILGGFKGLVEGNSIPIGSELSGLARRGGTFLGTSRNGHTEAAILEKGIEATLQACSVDALIVVGGGGSLEAASRLADGGVPIIGIPCTIDNDIYATDYALGFDSAVNKAVRTVDEIMDTAESLPERIFIVETLGNKTGHIAIATAYATDADAVFIHEINLDINSVADKIKAKMEAGGTNGLVVVGEHLGTYEIAQKLEELTGRRVRITILGHAQRGGSPTYFDRMVARQFGETAAQMAFSNDFGKMVTYVNGHTSSVPLGEIVGKTKDVDVEKFKRVNRV